MLTRRMFTRRSCLKGSEGRRKIHHGGETGEVRRETNTKGEKWDAEPCPSPLFGTFTGVHNRGCEEEGGRARVYVSVGVRMSVHVGVYVRVCA